MYLCFLDINNFKHVNDTYGHAVGDEVIKHLARIMQGELKKLKLESHLFRWGGDEFIILFKSGSINDVITSLEQLHGIVKSAPYKQTGAFPRPNNPIPTEGLLLSVACGVASIDDLRGLGLDYRNVLGLWEDHADRLTYFSKALVKEGFLEDASGIVITVFQHAEKCLKEISTARENIRKAFKEYLDVYHSQHLKDFRRKVQ